QAEDGIRDFHVTGVQTCALPIFRADAVADVLEDAVAEAVAGDVGRRRARRQGRGRPELTGFLVAQVERLAAAIAHRVVVPGRERSEERRVGKECRARWSAER